MSDPKSFVIALDGADGVGKTTQVELLVDLLKRQGRQVQSARHSGGTAIGEELRKVSLSDLPRPAETDLHISYAMGYALAEAIAGWRNEGKIVVLDRSPLAIVAYNGYGSQLSDVDQAFTACQQMCTAMTIDLLIVLTADETTINKRRTQRGTTDYFEQQDTAYHQRVRQGYEAATEFLQNQPHSKTNIISLDATSSIQSIHKSIVDLAVKMM